MNNSRIIGGVSKKSSEAAKEIYSSFVKGEIFLTDDVTAEFCKLIENAYRDVNIAFANELSLVAEKMGIDIKEAINIANKHPRVNILNPGIGVGGHCIPIDPWFIREVDEENTKMILASRQVNDKMPEIIAGKIKKKVKGLKNPKLIIVGLAYKANTDDIRESPSLKIADILKKEGYGLEMYDPLIEKYSYSSISEIVKGADCLVVLVEHEVVKKELESKIDEIKKNMQTPLILRF